LGRIQPGRNKKSNNPINRLLKLMVKKNQKTNRAKKKKRKKKRKRKKKLHFLHLHLGSIDIKFSHWWN